MSAIRAMSSTYINKHIPTAQAIMLKGGKEISLEEVLLCIYITVLNIR